MYINTTTLTVHSERDIRVATPNTSYPVPFVAPAGYAYIFPTPVPSYNARTHTAVQGAPELTMLGKWQESWVVSPIPTVIIAASLALAKSTKNQQIKAERDRRKLNGVFVQDKWIHSDIYSRTQWLGMVLMGAGIPAVEWTTMDGTRITTTQTLAGQVFQGIALLDATLFDYANSLIEQVNASTDPSSIDITTGWPATYEGAP